MKKQFNDYLEAVQSNSGIMKNAYNTAESDFPDFLSKDEKEINLSNMRLKSSHLRELFNKVENPDKIISLSLSNNELKDISEIKYFKNLEYLDLNDNYITDISILKDLTKLKELSLGYNNIKDISVIQYLKNLKVLDINNLELKSDQIKYIKSLKNLKNLYCSYGFKDIVILKQLNRNYRDNKVML